MPLSTKETMWLSCKDKSCCSFYTVFPTGLDIWKIATTLHVPPWSFVTLFPAGDDALDGFMVDQSGKRFRLALAKATVKDEGAPCIFLMHMADGFARCGLGEIRPNSCHSFPSILINGVIYLQNDGGCTCRKWSLSDVDIVQESVLLSNEMQDREMYYKVVANWNEYILRAVRGEIFSSKDFCRYLMDIYTQLSVKEPKGGNIVSAEF